MKYNHTHLMALSVMSLHLLASMPSQASPNQLQNPGFENNPPTTGWGNHIGHSIAPWVLGQGNSSNVIRVDNGATFMSAPGHGPYRDASNSPAGTVRHYLDIANGDNDFYQKFTSNVTGTVTFGGYFSTRGNNAGTAKVILRKGEGFDGEIIGDSNAVNLPRGNSIKDPWKLVSYTAEVTSGQTYSLVISMDNHMNFDEAFVRLKGNKPIHQTASVLDGVLDMNVLAKPRPNPCCPPINQSVIMRQLTHVAQPGGGSLANYRLNFAATQTFRNQMQHYIAYVNSMDPQINAIITTWRIIDRGPGSAGSSPPAPGFSPVASQFHTTFSVNAQPNLGNTQGYNMKPNRWYYIHTGTYFNGDRQFFDKKKCSTSSYWVNWMVVMNKSSQKPEGVLVVSDGNRILGKMKATPARKPRSNPKSKAGRSTPAQPRRNR